MRGADYRTEYCGCGTFLRMRKSVNIILVFALCAGNHDGAERVLGSKSLGNELFWTTINVLVVSPVVQRFWGVACETNL